jgi:hypothetical protein
MTIAMVLALRDKHDNRYPPEHWLKLAEEAREEARQLKDSEAKAELENVANLYQRLAEFAERLLSGRKAD